MESVSREEKERFIGEVLAMLDGSSLSGKPVETGMAVLSAVGAWMRSNGVSPEEMAKIYYAHLQTVISAFRLKP